MKLSQKTLTVLKNFSSINQGILVRPGSKLRTKSALNNIFSEVDVPDTFDKEFAIYDLNELLAAFSLLKDPELEFNENHILMKSDNNKIKYFYSNPSVVVAPVDKNIQFPEADIKFELTSSDFSNLIKAAGILKVSTVEFNQNGILLSNTNAVGNNFIIEKNMDSSKSSFRYSINVDNMKFIQDLSYQVEITDKGIAKFYSEEFGISYYVTVNAA